MGLDACLGSRSWGGHAPLGELWSWWEAGGHLGHLGDSSGPGPTWGGGEGVISEAARL